MIEEKLSYCEYIRQNATSGDSELLLILIHDLLLAERENCLSWVGDLE